MSTLLPPGDSEWLEPDGLGDFASGTVSGVRTRRYHGLLIPATKPPAGRTVPVNGLEAWVESAGTTFAISAQRYYPSGSSPGPESRTVISTSVHSALAKALSLCLSCIGPR